MRIVERDMEKPPHQGHRKEFEGGISCLHVAYHCHCQFYLLMVGGGGVRVGEGGRRVGGGKGWGLAYQI